MRLRQEGMVLIMIMFTMMVISMLLITQLQAILLYTKLQTRIERNHDDFYQLETAVRRVYPSTSLPCIFKDSHYNTTLLSLIQNPYCTIIFNNNLYHYWLIDLGIYPCLRINVGQKSVSSQHWLITIQKKALNQPALQLRIAEPTMETGLCHQKTLTPRNIHEGILSWRYISIQ